MDIDWAGTGLDRGLRGIAFANGLVYVAASREILVYDSNFDLVDRIGNRYLAHCHEIDFANGHLWVASTGFDSVLALDLKRRRFVRGYCLRYGHVGQLGRRMWKSSPAMP